MMRLATRIRPRITSFRSNKAPSWPATCLSKAASQIPAIVPDGQMYLQKKGVSLKQKGRSTTKSTSTTYLK